tara:strand:- start:1004 stop:1189 length:186 start_codon:yes stop_codon:yes gene_type:complete
LILSLLFVFLLLLLLLLIFKGTAATREEEEDEEETLNVYSKLCGDFEFPLLIDEPQKSMVS